MSCPSSLWFFVILCTHEDWEKTGNQAINVEIVNILKLHSNPNYTQKGEKANKFYLLRTLTPKTRSATIFCHWPFYICSWIPGNFNGRLYQCNSNDIISILISGLIALIFSCWSKATLARDWDGALLRGKIAFGFAVCGIVITVVAILGFVLIFYTRDT